MHAGTLSAGHVHRIPIYSAPVRADDQRTSRFPSDAIVVPDTRPAEAAERELGDFTAGRASLALAAIAVPLGVCVTFLALALLDLIGLMTHLAYTGTAATSIVGPDTSVLGWWSVLVPVAGGLDRGADGALRLGAHPRATASPRRWRRSCCAAAAWSRASPC